jgi:hypothetical protein
LPLIHDVLNGRSLSQRFADPTIPDQSVEERFLEHKLLGVESSDLRQKVEHGGKWVKCGAVHHMNLDTLSLLIPKFRKCGGKSLLAKAYARELEAIQPFS